MANALRALPFLLVLAAAGLLWLVADGFDFVARAGRPGPDLWPRTILIVMAAAATWGLIGALFRRADRGGTDALIDLAAMSGGRREEARRDIEQEAGDDRAMRLLPALAAIAAILGYVLVISLLGFFVSTFLLMLCVMLLGGYRYAVRTPAIALLGTLAFFFLFQRVAYISLPQGAGPFRDLTIWLMAAIGVR